jgi:hypothetical protein
MVLVHGVCDERLAARTVLATRNTTAATGRTTIATVR